MKQLVLILSAVALLLSAVGCGQPANLSSPAEASPTESVSPAPAPEEPPPEDSGGAEATESTPEPQLSAVFALGLGGQKEQTMGVGDRIGDWTLSDLQIDYDGDNRIQMLEATFAGDVTIAGSISPSALLEGAFDFRVAPEEEGKMPCYISPDMGQKDEIWMMLNLPEELAATLSLANGEQKECRITLRDYRFIFAYMMAPASATATSIEML